MEVWFKKHSWATGVLLAVAAVLAIVLQAHNVSRYNVYPDSYQSVTVAKNLKDYQRLAAPMGSGGLVYPDFFGWTRPFYPFLILVFSFFGFNLFTAAHVVAFSFGILSVFAVYFLVCAVLKSKKAGLAASVLLALSYSHAVWSGFIFTESLGVLMLSLAILALWRSRQIDEHWFTPQDLITGALFTLAVLTRYEYIALLIPAAFLVSAKFSAKRTASVIVTMLGLGVFTLALLHPFTGDFAWVWSQIHGFVIVILLSLAAIAAGLLLARNNPHYVPKIEKWSARAVLVFIILGSIALVARHSLYPGLWDFANNDPLLCTVTLFGLVLLLLGNKHERRVGVAVFAAIFILTTIYMQVNAGMERYLTHLSPIILVAAGYGAVRFSKLRMRPFVILFVVLALCLQGIKSWNGLHNSGNGIWYRQSYEEKSAQKLKWQQKTDQQDSLLVTSMPEPYYLFTGKPTQSIADQPPYIFANVPPSEKLTIVQDEGMRVIFPNFSKFVDKNLSSYQTDQYWVGEPLRYTNSIYPEKQPVKAYKITYASLQKLLDIHSTNR